MLKLNVQHHRGDFALDFAFDQAARVTGVFGPSGAGKSTLMHLIAGLGTPHAGRIELHNEPLFDSVKGINLPPHKRRIGMMFQDDRLFPHYDVEGNLRYAERAMNPSHATNGTQSLLDFDRVVDLLALRSLLTRRTSTLSGGERQRIALGRALLANPKLLLLDEPLSSLDAGLKRQILPYLAKVRDAAGIPMLYVSHDLTEMLQVTDQMLLLERGRVVAHGRFNDLAHAHAALDALREGGAGLVNVLRARRDRAGDADGSMRLILETPGVAKTTANATSQSSAPVVHVAARDALGGADADRESMDIVIRASDVALALQQVQGVSIQNQLRGEIARLTPHAGGVIVEVDLGGVPLLAELTQRAVQSLQLQPGKVVWCLIKSNAIRAGS